MRVTIARKQFGIFTQFVFELLILIISYGKGTRAGPGSGSSLDFSEFFVCIYPSLDKSGNPDLDPSRSGSLVNLEFRIKTFLI